MNLHMDCWPCPQVHNKHNWPASTKTTQNHVQILLGRWAESFIAFYAVHNTFTLTLPYPPINRTTLLTMVITEEIPQLAPVSDDSAASSTSDLGSYGFSLNCTPVCRVPSKFHDVPAHVLDDALRRDSLGSLDSSVQKKVRFGDIECRRYPVQLGDHPECAMGPPVSARIFSSEMLVSRKPCAHTVLFMSTAYNWLGTLQNVYCSSRCLRIRATSSPETRATAAWLDRAQESSPENIRCLGRGDESCKLWGSSYQATKESDS